MDIDYKEFAKSMHSGKVALLPTDTIYGLSTSALSRVGVERIYNLKKRDLDKPFIVLIGSTSQLEELGANISSLPTSVDELWPGPNTIILSSSYDEYLHRGLGSLAVRLPGWQPLRELLLETGPLVSTSANTQANPHINSVEEAKAIFGEKIDLYIDVGPLHNPPSNIYRVEEGELLQLR